MDKFFTNTLWEIKITSLSLAAPNPKNMMQVHKNNKGTFTPPPPPNYVKISLLCFFMSIFTLSAISQNLPNTLPDTGFVG
ncbi:MAG: hypothetical protein HUU48_08285, partial [Flavobacteriales bacterium]|nr:hypothetical protein [Flavobacteriales bacterium]